jgi:hypothetical protein
MAERLYDWPCECGRFNCTAFVLATITERDDVDGATETHWLVVPEHVRPDDDVVRASPRFAVVKSDR